MKTITKTITTTQNIATVDDLIDFLSFHDGVQEFLRILKYSKSIPYFEEAGFPEDIFRLASCKFEAGKDVIKLYLMCLKHLYDIEFDDLQKKATGELWYKNIFRRCSRWNQDYTEDDWKDGMEENWLKWLKENEVEGFEI